MRVFYCIRIALLVTTLRFDPFNGLRLGFGSRLGLGFAIGLKEGFRVKVAFLTCSIVQLQKNSIVCLINQINNRLLV